MSLKFITPTAIGDAQFVSSTRAENDHAAWSSGTTYAAGDRVIKTATHRIYESMQDGNLNNDPATDNGTYWVDVGPTNRWAMFDQAIGTVTEQATPLTVVLDPGIVNALALLDIEGATVTVTMLDEPGGTEVYSREFDIGDNALIGDWWGYFFEPITPKTTLIVTDLPPYSSGRLTVSIVAAPTAKCGTLVVGSATEVGDIRPGARVGIIDYSKKETDEFGATRVVERAYAKRFELDVMVLNTRLDYVTRKLAAVRATPVVWLDSADKYESLTAYGWARDWGAVVAYPTRTDLAITIEGLA